jgi:hypothetical protein
MIKFFRKIRYDFMIKKYMGLNILLMVLTILAIIGGCTSSTPTYEPRAGEPNLSLMTGRWKGVIVDDDENIYQSWYDGKLQMNGEKAGQFDILDFSPLNSGGEPDADSYGEKLFVTSGEISYSTTEYPISNWEQTESLNFKWNLLGNSYNYDKVGYYRDYVKFERKQDSLLIIRGRMIMADSTLEIFFYSRYGQIKK